MIVIQSEEEESLELLHRVSNMVVVPTNNVTYNWMTHSTIHHRNIQRRQRQKQKALLQTSQNRHKQQRQINLTSSSSSHHIHHNSYNEILQQPWNDDTMMTTNTTNTSHNGTTMIIDDTDDDNNNTSTRISFHDKISKAIVVDVPPMMSFRATPIVQQQYTKITDDHRPSEMIAIPMFIGILSGLGLCKIISNSSNYYGISSSSTTTTTTGTHSNTLTMMNKHPLLSFWDIGHVITTNPMVLSKFQNRMKLIYMIMKHSGSRSRYYNTTNITMNISKLLCMIGIYNSISMTLFGPRKH